MPYIEIFEIAEFYNALFCMIFNPKTVGLLESSMVFLERYQCNLVLDGFGFEGQKKLKQTSVLVVGLGGIGSIVSMYLAANGVGKLGICDYDYVAVNNLTRQLLYNIADVGRAKVVASYEKLLLLNPDVELVSLPLRLEKGNAKEIVSEYEYIVEGSDSLETKYLINEICMKANKKTIICSAVGYKGNVLTVLNHNSACWECIFENEIPQILPTCQDMGVFPVVPAITGLLAVSEALLNICGIDQGGKERPNFIAIDLKESSIRYLKINKNLSCYLHKY